MFNQLRKYRNFFTIGLLGFYLAGGLQFPLLECLHFLTHLDDLVAGKFQSHGYYSHGDHHEHLVLDVFDQMDEDVPLEQAPTNGANDVEAKKFPQIIKTEVPFEGCLAVKQISNYRLKNKWSSLFLSAPSPPPRA